MTGKVQFTLCLVLLTAICILLFMLYHSSYSYSLSLIKYLKANLSLNYFTTLQNSVVALLQAIFYLLMLGLMLLFIIELLILYCRIAN